MKKTYPRRGAGGRPKGLQFGRAGFAGRGTPFARSTERHTLAFRFRPETGSRVALLVRADARAVAHQVLVRVETTDAFADVLLADRLARAPMSAVDRALATRLVYGTLAWQGRLEHHLKGLVRMPLADLDPPVRAALRLGLYQLLFLDRVPAYAAVHTSVGLARVAAGAGAAGLVNAVLRRAAGAGVGGLPLPSPTADPLERLAIEW